MSYRYDKLRLALVAVLCIAIGLGCVMKDAPPFRVNLPVWTGNACEFQLQPIELTTLESLKEMRGQMGRVMYHPDNLLSKRAILEKREGFRLLDVSFALGDGVYTALDYRSLYAASLYRAVEAVVLKFRSLSDKADLAKLNPSLAEMFLVFQTKFQEREYGKAEHDNAVFLKVDDKDYILAFPSEQADKIPFPLNVGVFAHEATHVVNYYLWHGRLEAQKTDQVSLRTMHALQEGMADYVGFVISGDPNFIQCTDQAAARPLRDLKELSAGAKSAIDQGERFNPYESGLVWATAQYQIGSLIGHDENLKSLIEMFVDEKKCLSAEGPFDWERITKCHLDLIGTKNSELAPIYDRAFKPYRGKS